MRVLILDDEESMRHMLSVILKREGYDCTSVGEAGKALEMLEAGDFDFVLSDIKMPGMDGMAFLKALKEKNIDSTVIMMSAYGTVDTAIECMKLGAYDYVSKPFKADEIALTLRKAEERERLKKENRRLRDTVAGEYNAFEIITDDRGMKEVLSLVKKVAGYSTTVLITGESGTGKELVARAIHSLGERSSGPFIAVNCGAIPPLLLESELFGHVKGAFTDAHRTRAGLFEEASGGTIFLDEVGELPIELQVKLLRVLQEGEIRRVGDTRPIKTDARVVAATVKDLKEEVRKGRFREDLFYRLNVIEVRVPSLRERPGDIQPLALHFIEKYSRKFNKPLKELSEGALALLRSYPWPGNVRELENAIERAMILEDTDTIKKESLPIAPSPPSPANKARGEGGRALSAENEDLSIKKAHEAMERELIRKALEKTGNNRTRAAEILEISHRALLYKIKSYGL